MRREHVIRFLDSVIIEGENMQRKDKAGAAGGGMAARWYPRVVTVFQILGDRADPWKHAVARCPTENSTASTAKLIGVLRAIREAVDLGMVQEIEDIAHTDAMSSLLDHGRELAREGHASAAGATVASVLHEILRERCEHAGCLPDGASSSETLTDSLYRRGELDKKAAERVRTVATIASRSGLDANPPLTAAEVDEAIDEVLRLLEAGPG